MARAVKWLKLDAGTAADPELKIGASTVTYKRGARPRCWARRAIRPIFPRHAGLRLQPSGQDFRKHPITMAGGPERALLGIVDGLLETSDIVYRDLKPGTRCFGRTAGGVSPTSESRSSLVEDAASLETLRNSLTPPYRAPEQWRGERPTHATDVYALGCYPAYALLTGAPPFTGDVDTVREAHLHKSPHEMDGVHPRLAGLLANMLRKSQEARPSLSRVRAVLASVDENSANSKRFALVEAGAIVSKEQAAADAIMNERLCRRTGEEGNGERGHEGLPNNRLSIFRSGRGTRGHSQT